MRYICEECDSIIEDDDVVDATTYDTVEYWGQNVSMPYTIYRCPHCNSEVEEYYE